MKRALLAAAMTLAILAQTGVAAIPQTISYQGILKNDLGEIVPDGDYDFIFSLYDVDIGDTALWTEGRTLTVTDGVFDVLLGETTPLDLPFDIQYWLGVTIDPDPELTPRVKLGSTGYALNSSRLGGLDPSSYSLVLHSHTLDDLSDTDCPTPGDGEVLVFDSGSGAWVNAPVPAAEDGDWIIDGDDLHSGVPGKVGIGMTPPGMKAADTKPDGRTDDRNASNAKLKIGAYTPNEEAALYGFLSDTNDDSDRRAAIFGYRNSGYYNPGLDYNIDGTNNAVTGANWFGDPYSFGVAGYSYFDGPNTGGVIGSEWDGGTWGALGFKDADSEEWGIYTPYDAHIGNRALVGAFEMNSGATDGHVLTSDADGVGTWQAPAAVPDNDWTMNGSNMYSNVSGNVGIGTTAPAAELHIVKNLNGSTNIQIENTDPGAYSTQSIEFPDEGGNLAGISIYDDDNVTYPSHLRITNNRPNASLALSIPNNYLFLANNGNVGIGTTSPESKLDVNGSVEMDGFKMDAGAATGKVLTSDIDGVGTWQTPVTFIGGSGATNYLAKFTSTTTIMNSALYQNATNEIGLGNSDPSAKLDVTSASDDAIEGRCTHTFQIDRTGVIGHSVPADYYGIGGQFYGGYHGVQAFVEPTGSNTYTGFYGFVSGGSGTNRAFYGYAGGSGTNWAGYFSGSIYAVTASAGIKAFKIDHPLDPENKYLNHSSVESSDMMNLYNGNVLLDASGEAWVTMPEWFEALNMEFRYQLTCIGGFAQVYIAEEISGNRFKIAGGEPGLKISWQVTGIRHDPLALARRIQVEEDKSLNEAGKYLNPEAYGLSESMGEDYEDRMKAERAAYDAGE